jgi:hypothetical protein
MQVKDFQKQNQTFEDQVYFVHLVRLLYEKLIRLLLYGLQSVQGFPILHL